MTRKSLVILLPSLATGGAERVHINMAATFMAEGYDVTFLLQNNEGELTTAVPNRVKIVSLNAKRTITSLLPLVQFLRRTRPDIVVSNLGHTNIIAILARLLARTHTHIIVTFHNTLSAECAAHANWQYRILPLLCRLLLRFSHGIVAVSKGVADDLVSVTGIARERIWVIYNPVITDDFEARLAEPETHPWLMGDGPPVILGVGRFTPQKDFATLITAFAQTTNTRLILLGDGPERAKLVALAESLGVAERMSMPGYVLNPLPYMRKAAALVMSSRYEGFGNVLVEALACGTAVISTNCPSGPAEILVGGRYGKLVPVGDAQAMSEAITATLAAPHEKEILQMRGREFTVWRAVDGYLKLFNAEAIKDKKIDALIQLLIDLFGRDIRDILVVGCGTGREAGTLARAYGANVVGIDIESEFAFDHEDAFPAKLMNMDACKLDFADSSFDLVFSFHALEHIKAPEMALKEMARVLKPEGAYMIGTPNKSRVLGYIGSAVPLGKKIIWNLKDIRMRLSGQWSNEAGAHAGFSRKELNALCQNAFGDAKDISNDYYKRLYASKGRAIALIIKSRLKTILFPCVYVAGKRNSLSEL